MNNSTFRTPHSALELRAVDPAHNSHMYYVYLIYSRKSGKYYIGYTSDLRKRLSKHNTSGLFIRCSK